MTDVFEKNEKKNKTTSVYRLAYMIIPFVIQFLNGQKHVNKDAASDTLSTRLSFGFGLP